MTKNTKILLAILAGAFLLKLPFFSVPITGHFGSYQALNAMMAEMMGRGSALDLLIPRTFVLINGEPSLHLLYYPFGSLAAFLLQGLFGGGLPWWGRFQAAAFMAGAGWFLYDSIKRSSGPLRALWAVFFFSFFPVVLLSGIALQNEAAAVFFITLSYWLLTGTEAKWRIFLSGIVISLAMTARLHAIMLLPAFLWKINEKKVSLLSTVAFLIACALPLLAWTGWMYYLDLHYAGHIKTSLFSQSGEGRVLVAGLLVSPQFYLKILEILATEWCTPLLFIVAAAGLCRFKNLDRTMLLWLAGTLGLVFLLPQKVLDHPFYLIIGTPALAVLISSTLEGFWGRWNRWARAGFCAVFLALSLLFFLPKIAVSGSDRNIETIGHYVAQVTQPGDRIIAQHGSSGDLLYYTHRFGWSFFLKMSKETMSKSNQARQRLAVQEGYGDPVEWLEKLRKDGAKFLVISEPAEYYASSKFAEHVRSRYEPVEVPDKSFLMFRLERK